MGINDAKIREKKGKEEKKTESDSQFAMVLILETSRPLSRPK